MRSDFMEQLYIKKLLPFFVFVMYLFSVIFFKPFYWVQSEAPCICYLVVFPPILTQGSLLAKCQVNSRKHLFYNQLKAKHLFDHNGMFNSFHLLYPSLIYLTEKVQFEFGETAKHGVTLLPRYNKYNK